MSGIAVADRAAPVISPSASGPRVLHRDVVGAVELAAVVDADDVRVLKAGRRLGLAAEALDELVVLGEALVQQLQRHPAPRWVSSAQQTSAIPPEPIRSSTR